MTLFFLKKGLIYPDHATTYLDSQAPGSRRDVRQQSRLFGHSR
jgi:hypothetical protein